MGFQEYGSVLGIDVGCSPTRRTSAACRLDWTRTEVGWSIDRFRALESERRETIARVAGPAELQCVAIDGPIRKGFDIIGRYRVAERMLTRKLQPLIGKPGQSSVPVGKLLNEHANACALAALNVANVAPATHRLRIDDSAVVEAFPSSFLGLMIAKPKEVIASRTDRSDTFYRHLTATGELQRLITYLLPGRELRLSFDSVTNRDDRAGLVCALVALAIARQDFTAVGDEDGWIILPPRSFVQDWGWSLLQANAESPTHLHSERPQS